MERILVGVDGSASSLRAVDFAADLASKYNAELIVLTVVPHFSPQVDSAVEEYARLEHIPGPATELVRTTADNLLELVVSPRLLLALSRSEPREFSSRGCLRAGKLLLRGLDRPLTGARGSNDDRALAAAEKLFVSGNFIDEAHAIARHLFLSHPAIDNYCLPIL